MRFKELNEDSQTAVDIVLARWMTLWIVGMLSITDDFAISSASEYSALCLRKYFLATLCLFVC
jgi:hypothetical protein